jgi:hypothetical protein
MEGPFGLLVDAVEAAFVIGRLVDRDAQEVAVVPPAVAAVRRYAAPSLHEPKYNRRRRSEIERALGETR